MKTLKLCQHLEIVEDIDKLNKREISRAIRDAIVAELIAIKQYEVIADATNREISKVMQDIADEEKVHVGELQELLRKMDINEEEFLEEGASEVKEINASKKSDWPQYKDLRQEELKSEDNFVDISFKVSGDAISELIKLLQHCDSVGGGGHSFEIIIDPEIKENKRTIYFDGDGSDRIKDIKLNGRKIDRNFLQ